ncbi:single-stranded-DNA-specific exonuclease RecJ, partial [Rickettsiales bacterium]|nr:single-stranded-DNA-specific exonuclease RecJ [Rickettsiales bacterium]
MSALKDNRYIKAIDRKSVSDSIWLMADIDERLALTLSQKFDFPEIVARILASRNVDIDVVEEYIEPTLKSLLPDPFHLLDMRKAAERTVYAIENNESIAVFGDYDVDGATSSALLARYFRSLGIEPNIYIPDRIKEGYGPNTQALLHLHKCGVNLCITVDCGTMSFEPLAKAKEAGLDIIVLDHHISEEILPDALAVVNPNRLDETSEHGYMAAVGVAFIFAIAVNSLLRERGYFKDRKEPALMKLLDIVALGTVCDVVPLKGVNRAFVKQGLKVMQQRQNIGLKALADCAGVDSSLSTYHLGFVLGPRINAGGRVGQAGLGTRLLTTEDVDEAYKISQQLDIYNSERKTIEQLVLDEAFEQVENADKEAALIFVKNRNWHPGVIGIVAGRIKEKYNRPVAVIAIDENGIGKASARSVSGVDFGVAVVAAYQSGLLIAGGGHAMAAGFSVEESKIDELYKFISKRFEKDLDNYKDKVIKLGAAISLSAINIDLIKNIQ